MIRSGIIYWQTVADKTGLVQDTNKKWYYITNDGERKVGLVKDSDGAYHYLTPEGERKTGSITI